MKISYIEHRRIFIYIYGVTSFTIKIYVYWFWNNFIYWLSHIDKTKFNKYFININFDILFVVVTILWYGILTQHIVVHEPWCSNKLLATNSVMWSCLVYIDVHIRCSVTFTCPQHIQLVCITSYKLHHTSCLVSYIYIKGTTD